MRASTPPGTRTSSTGSAGWWRSIPTTPSKVPIKRTALGRFAHEGAACSVGANRRLAFYMGDDWNFEYVYKFVPRRAWEPGNPDANRNLLDDGILYVARFNADGSGRLAAPRARDGAAHRRERLRRSGRRAGADAPGRGCRGRDQDGSAGMGGRAPGDPRGVLRVQQQHRARDRRLRGRQCGQPPRAEPVRPHRALAGAAQPIPSATRFQWDVWVEAGPAAARRHHQGRRVRVPRRALDRRAGRSVGSDRRLAPLARREATSRPSATTSCWRWILRSGAFRRFLTGPRGCEITGFHTTPDNRTAFVNIQHPGEAPGDRSESGESPRQIQLA